MAAEIEAERLATQEARRSEHYRKLVSFTKKSGKKRLENASVVDLRQPKDRDPQTNNDPSIQAVIDSIQPLFDFGLSTQELVSIGYDRNSSLGMKFSSNGLTNTMVDGLKLCKGSIAPSRTFMLSSRLKSE